MITSVNAFPFGCPYKWRTQPLGSIDVLTRLVHKWTGSVGYKNSKIISIIQIFEKEIARNSVLSNYFLKDEP